jgi:septum site-determining protein MinD
MVQRGDMLAAEDVLELLAIKLVGLVPEDESVIISTNKGTPIALDNNSKAGTAFRNIAARISGDDVPFIDLYAESGLLDRLSKFLRPGGS